MRLPSKTSRRTARSRGVAQTLFPGQNAMAGGSGLVIQDESNIGAMFEAMVRSGIMAVESQRENQTGRSSQFSVRVYPNFPPATRLQPLAPAKWQQVDRSFRSGEEHMKSIQMTA